MKKTNLFSAIIFDRVLSRCMRWSKKKNSTTKAYLLFLLLAISMSCLAQLERQTYTNVYDLHFTMKSDSTIIYPWRENASYSNYSISAYRQDSNRKLFIKRYLKGFPFYKRLRTEYEQRILLPDSNMKEAKVEFESKGKNIKLVSVVLDVIDGLENTLFSDTLILIPDTVLSSASKSIALTNAKMMNVRITAEGDNDKDAYIAFSKLNILIDGKPIDAFPVNALPPLPVDRKTNYTTINSNEKIELEQINEIYNKKIIGLGESMHGNNGIKNLAYQLIFQAVERLNCKLILLEMPLEKSFAYNRFIQDESYELDSLIVIDQARNNFLNNLRIFNSDKTKDSKVKLYGFDYNKSLSSTQNSAIDIFDFITNLNQELQIPEVDQFSLLLMKEDLSDAINFLDSYREKIEKLLTTEETECILHILRVSKNMGDDGIERFRQRDSVMFVNAKFLIDKFAKNESVKTIIYGHAVHINPISTYPAVPCTPFGCYMRETYTESYSPILFLIGNGKSMAYDESYNIKNNTLSIPPNNSIEYFLNSIEADAFYIPLTPNFNKLTLSRFKGSHHIPQEFYPFNLYQRYKGVFFIKNTDYANIDQIEVPFDKASEMHLNKIKHRKKTLEELQKRNK